MKSSTKIMATAGVFVAGTTLAWWFRKPSPAADSIQPGSSAHLKLRDQDGVPTPAAATAAGRQGVPLPGGSPAAVASLESPAAREGAIPAAETLPPRPPVPPVFNPLPQRRPPQPADARPPAGVSAANASGSAWVRSAAEDDRSTPGERPAESSTRPEDLGWRTHTIIDGDTLSLLAIRYLGSPGRYAEIFEANRDVLAGPDMLRLGVALKIPPRQNRLPRGAPAVPPGLVPIPTERASAGP